MAKKGAAKRNSKAKAQSKDAVQARALEIMQETGLGFVRSLIRARNEAGLVSPNRGKERAPAAEAASA